MDDGITHTGSREALLGVGPSAAERVRFSADRQVDVETPPAFLVHAADDQAVPVENSLLYHRAMLKNGIPGELHVYEKGGHGFGFSSPGLSTAKWPEALEVWMRMNGWLA
jgi:dipeptidyl aminopeptidase/acylaminoacyl peptidase